jgi:hypothetical protein
MRHFPCSTRGNRLLSGFTHSRRGCHTCMLPAAWKMHSPLVKRNSFRNGQRRSHTPSVFQVTGLPAGMPCCTDEQVPLRDVNLPMPPSNGSTYSRHKSWLQAHCPSGVPTRCSNTSYDNIHRTIIRRLLWLPGHPLTVTCPSFLKR